MKSQKSSCLEIQRCTVPKKKKIELCTIIENKEEKDKKKVSRRSEERCRSK